MSKNGNYLFQGLEFIRCGEKVFRVWQMHYGIFRKCHVHNQKSAGGNNPGFVMFTDASNDARPEKGHVQVGADASSLA